MIEDLRGSRILVLTLAIGADYRRKLSRALESKRAYCEKHGYDYVEAHEESWNRERPIAWSKVLLWKKYSSSNYDYIWISDADVYITNPSLRLEEHVLPLLPKEKNLLMTFDSCQHVNSGNMILRPGAWATEFCERVWEQTDFIYHIWWENAAICYLLAYSEKDRNAIEVTMDAWRFNAYLCGIPGSRLWERGDFLVHFAGVYNPDQMANLMDVIDRGETPRIPM